MQIFYTVTSPFARKVSMLAKAANISGITWCISNPMESEELRKANPLGKVPALIDGDLCLFESALICEYLDCKRVAAGSEGYFCKNRPNYFPVQQAHMTANGILEAAVASMFEKRRVASEQSQFWLERWETAITTALKSLNLNHSGTAENPNIATFAITAALGYLDFRHPHITWRSQRQDISDWFDQISKTEWFQLTQPGTELN